MQRVLIVEDEPTIVDTIEHVLRAQGYAVTTADNGDKALEVFRRDPPDLALLDIGLPGLGGLDLLRQMRDLRPAQPIIMVTSRVEEADRIVGLELGADDYITKPFSPRELVARVRTVLRRVLPAEPMDKIIRYGRMTIRLFDSTLLIHGKTIPLARGERIILHALCLQPTRIFTRDQLLDLVHGIDAGAIMDRAVDAIVRRIRKKLEEACPGYNPILSLYGQGYKLRPEEEDEG